MTKEVYMTKKSLTTSNTIRTKFFNLPSADGQIPPNLTPKNKQQTTRFSFDQEIFMHPL